MSEKQKERIWIMSRPYVNGSFAQQGRQRRKNRIILLVALLAVLCLVGVIAAVIQLHTAAYWFGCCSVRRGVDGATAGGSHDHAARHEGVGTSKGRG